MRLLVPVISKEDVLEFQSGADNLEFYLGFQLPEWTGKFGLAEELNRMSSFQKTANMQGIDDIPEIVQAACDSDVFVTLNSPAYSILQEKFLEEIMQTLAQMGVAGVILGDVFLARKAAAAGLKPVAGTMIGIYNADLAAFCRDEGFERLILPRDLTLIEMEEIIGAVPDMEYECFLMRNGCRFSDSNCLGRHSGRYGAVCTYLDRSKTVFCGAPEVSFSAHDAAVFNHHVWSQAFHKSACGMCAVWDLMQMGVSSGKVVGRADGRKSVGTDVRELAENIRIAAGCHSREEYLEKMHLPFYYDTICYQGCNCYYPEVRYPMGV